MKTDAFTVPAEKVSDFIAEDLCGASCAILGKNAGHLLELLGDLAITNLFVETSKLHGIEYIAFKSPAAEYTMDIKNNRLLKFSAKQITISLSPVDYPYQWAKTIWEDLPDGTT